VCVCVCACVGWGDERSNAGGVQPGRRSLAAPAVEFGHGLIAARAPYHLNTKPKPTRCTSLPLSLQVKKHIKQDGVTGFSLAMEVRAAKRAPWGAQGRGGAAAVGDAVA